MFSKPNKFCSERQNCSRLLEPQKVASNARGCSTVADRVQLEPHVNLVSIVPWEERRGEEVK